MIVSIPDLCTLTYFGNQMLCEKEEMWTGVCEASYSVASNTLEELYSLMPRRIAGLFKAKELQRNTDFMVYAYTYVYVQLKY